MKRIIIVVAFLIGIFTYNDSVAGPGDTTWVNTFNWTWPVNPGWGAPREGWFNFPSDTISYSKVLMYYTLKCDPAQNPQCGEWDYLTYSNLYEHTGKLDSNLLFHSNYIIDGQTPDSSMLMHSPSFNFFPRFENTIEYTDTTSLQSGIVGTGVVTIPFLQTGKSEGKLMYLYKAAELNGIGIYAGFISGIKINIAQNIIGNTRIILRVKQTNIDTLDNSAYLNSDFIKVFDHKFTNSPTGWLDLNFYNSFLWDGSSNLIIEFSAINDLTSAIPVIGNNTSWVSGLNGIGTDNFLDFEGTDYVEIPATAFNTLSNQVTIAFWMFGDPNENPQNNSIFEAVDSLNRRILNVHLPWSDEHVYWDAGSNGSYDRVEKIVSGVSDYKGKWNHWAFVKNAVTGDMAIYLNGQLFINGTAKTMLMSGIKKFRIGCSVAFESWYDGFIDDFSVWNKAFTQSEIYVLMQTPVTVSHPNYSNLLAAYDFNDINGYVTNDLSSNNADGIMFGMPNKLNYEGVNRFKNFSNQNYRPNITFEQGVYTSHVDSVLVVDSLQKAPLSVVLFNNTLSPTLPTDTIFLWPSYYNYTYNSLGETTSYSLVTPDTILYRVNIPYYSEPYEKINRYELGRFITPYGNNLSLGTGWTWVYDVSDFRKLLVDSVHLTAGNFQELLDMKFAFIEGTPPRNIIKIENVWQGDFGLSNIDQTVLNKNITLDTASFSYKLRICTTGHQFDNSTNCAEFCPKIHRLKVNGTEQFNWQIIQNCGWNPLFPQGGTWIYARAGWCPGMEGKIQEFELTPFVYSNNVQLDYDPELDAYGNYVIESQLVQYSSPNFNLDASIEAIISPSTNKIYSRFNPVCGQPHILIKNTGATTLTSLNITYGPVGGNSNVFTWTGNLEFMDTVSVYLPAFDWGTYTGNTFLVTLSSPNGGTDQYLWNNQMKSTFDVAPTYNGTLIVYFYANMFPNENMYQFIDDQGNIVHQKSTFNASALNKDTVHLVPGCYRFRVYDYDDDGLSFWANSDGGGSIRFRLVGGAYVKIWGGDFGSGIDFQFKIGATTEIPEIDRINEINVFPNPVNDNLFVNIADEPGSLVDYVISDITGKQIISGSKTINYSDEDFNISTSDLSNGLYFIRVSSGNKLNKQFKIIVCHE
ncbi:MAG: T9SS type A sorting domain-containing protein [Bacteroidia bacterium]|nr:T9SS type A sorting domain-containing protein [Bacteroidia bacterium]